VHLKLPLRRRTLDQRRRALAIAIFRLIEEAKRPRAPFSSAVPVERRAILGCERQLLNLADDLKATAQPVNAEGVVLVERLLRDGGSPVYRWMGDGALEHTLRDARAALLLGA
jgi:hypothetical protein